MNREQILRQFRFSCCFCGKKRTVEDLHHIKPKKHGGDDTFENLILLCPSCHRVIHFNHTLSMEKFLYFLRKIRLHFYNLVTFIEDAIHQNKVELAAIRLIDREFLFLVKLFNSYHIVYYLGKSLLKELLKGNKTFLYFKLLIEVSDMARYMGFKTHQFLDRLLSVDKKFYGTKEEKEDVKVASLLTSAKIYGKDGNIKQEKFLLDKLDSLNCNILGSEITFWRFAHMLRTKQYENILDKYDQCCSLKEGDIIKNLYKSKVLNELGGALIKVEELKRAEIIMRKSLALTINQGAIRDEYIRRVNLGRILIMMNRHKEAMEQKLLAMQLTCYTAGLDYLAEGLDLQIGYKIGTTKRDSLEIHVKKNHLAGRKEL